MQTMVYCIVKQCRVSLTSFATMEVLANVARFAFNMMRYTTGCSSGVAQSGAAFYEEGDAVFWAQADGGVEVYAEGCT
ncbi:MAG TPA: hypothetical protein VK638_29160 [Edaphobacter sp.]|nr:hypothetical protein [Edaphobacter sp.]